MKKRFQTLRTLWYPLIVILAIFGCKKDKDFSTSEDPNNYGPFLQQTLDQAVKEDPLVRNAVLLVESPRLKLRWTGASGLADSAAGVAMNPDHPFLAASIGKFTLAALVLKLSEEGRLNLDDKLELHLSNDIINEVHVINGVSYGKTLTLRQLLNHTSGLPDYYGDFINEADKADGSPYFFELLLSNPDKFWTPIETINYTKQYLKPLFAPGEGWHYSDTNYQLIGLVVEKVTGMQLHEAYRKWLFNPLKMNDTYMHLREQPRGKALSHVYLQDYDITNVNALSADWGGGGIATTTGDLQKFMRAIVNDSYFTRPATKQAMLNWVPTPEYEGYGLGIQKIIVAGEELIGHGGAYHSGIYYWKAKDAVISYTLNQNLPTIRSTETILIPVINELKKSK
jgi:D-alanyl-D-alanine carboxypeptidase